MKTKIMQAVERKRRPSDMPPQATQAERAERRVQRRREREMLLDKRRLGVKDTEITGNNYIDSDILEGLELEEEISSHDDQLRKKYRRRAELPDPTQAADAEINRLTQQVKLRLDPQIVALIDEAVAASQSNRSDWLVEAALEKIKQERPDLYAQLTEGEVPNPK